MTQSSDRQRAPWFRIGPDLNMRVSDAERAEVADRLARHFGDGRLDQAEFDDRMGRAMSAKTVGDLQGLLDDLPGDSLNGFPGGTAKAPGTPPPAADYAAGRRRGPLRGPVRALLTFVVVLVAANVVWHAVLGWTAPLVILAAIVAAIVLVSRRSRRCN
jgi:hypothetical protein